MITIYYPIYLDIKDRPCLVVGGGKIALRKIKGLLECGAEVEVVSLKVEPAIKEIVPEDNIQIGPYNSTHCVNKEIVIAATNDNQLNQQIYHDAKKNGALINVVDQPHLCQFIMPAVVRRGKMQIAISTGGSSPALAKKIRQELEGKYSTDYDDKMELMDQLRTLIKENVENSTTRQKIFDKMAELVKN